MIKINPGQSRKGTGVKAEIISHKQNLRFQAMNFDYSSPNDNVMKKKLILNMNHYNESPSFNEGTQNSNSVM
jgi:hypothetical protein